MLRWEDFQETVQIQTTVFTPNLLLSTSELLKKLINLEQDLFDGDPFVLPLPDDAPKEIPRITLQNKEKTYRLEVAPIRINFFRNKVSDEDRLIPNDFIQTAANILTTLLDNIGTQCGRIAIVMNRFSIKNDPAKEIALHFCKDNFMDEPFDRPSEFEIHSLKKYIFLETFNVNSWVRIKSGLIETDEGILRHAITAQQDINTQAEETKIYSKVDILHFYEKIYDEFDKILKLYLP